MKSESKVTMPKSLEADTMSKPKIQTVLILDDGTFPNNDTLALILMQQVFDPVTKNLVGTIEKAFHGNAWGGSWRNGIFTFHHYHSTAHEVLGLYAGRVKAQFGGPDGQAVTAKAGDVIIIPAGVAHKNLDQSPDFRCVGAYPAGQSPDMQYGKPGEQPLADKNIRSVPLPKTDPVFGKNGPLLELWGKTVKT
jgi:uncharacterized protein YjlB